MFEKYNIVAILTAYKRDYFKFQINSILNQTVKIDKIVILNNGSIDLSSIKNEFGDKVDIIHSELNTKFWGRFSIANLFNCNYILMLDDDVIPGVSWVENCLRVSNERDCIVTANGRDNNNSNEIGDSGHVSSDTKVAFGGHSWFYKKEYLKYFLGNSPINYNTGEDIMFSALCKINGGVETWVPSQSGESSAHKKNFSDDEHASFRQNNWDKDRYEICQYYINQGWQI